MKNAVIIICTRKESRRLPEKAFLKIAGVPAIIHILRRVLPSGLKTILAVPFEQEKSYEDVLRPAGLLGKVDIFPGDPDSPLHRTAACLAMQDPRPRYYVRITHDDLLIDLRTMLELLEAVEKGGYGYGMSPAIVEGAGVEVIETENLRQAADKHSKPTEFISWYVRGSVYNPKVLRFEPRASVRRGYRMTLDYPEDATVLEAVMRAVGSEATLDRVVEYLDKHQSLLQINRLPLVSVYTPVRNGARWIGEALDSSLSEQALGAALEHIVVDDCSEDDTIASAAAFAGDRRLRIVLNDRRMYVSGSSNKAIALARGRYVLRLDADDMLLTGALPRMVRAIEKLGAMALYSGYNEINEWGKTTSRHQRPNLELAGCAMMRRDWVHYYGFNEGLTHHDGVEFARRMGDFKIAQTNEVLWSYRVHPGSHSRNGNNQAERQRAWETLGAQ